MGWKGISQNLYLAATWNILQISCQPKLRLPRKYGFHELFLKNLTLPNFIFSLSNIFVVVFGIDR